MLFNAVPLLLLAAAYAAVTAALLPVLWRDRARAHPLDWAIALSSRASRVAAGDLRRARPARAAAARRPPLARPSPRRSRRCCRRCCSWRAGATAPSSSAGSAGRWRPRSASRHRDRELEAVDRASRTRSAARATRLEVARPLVQHVTSLCSASASPASSLVDEERRRGRPASTASSTARRRTGGPSSRSTSQRAVGDRERRLRRGAGQVFDVASSPLVSPRLVADRRRRERLLDPDDRRGARDRRALASRRPTRSARSPPRSSRCCRRSPGRRRSRSSGCARRRRSRDALGREQAIARDRAPGARAS